MIDAVYFALVSIPFQWVLAYLLGRWIEAIEWREARGTKCSGGRNYVVYEDRRD